MQELVEFAGGDHRLELAPAGDVMAIDEDLRNEVDGTAALDHFIAVGAGEEILAIPMYFLGGKGEPPAAEVVHGLVAEAADVGVVDFDRRQGGVAHLDRVRERVRIARG